MRSLNCLKSVAAAALLAGSTLLSTPWASASLGVDITANGPNGFALTNPPFTIGWAFDVTSSANVYALGVWDEGANGLNEAHDVGLWDGTGLLLRSTTVPNGLAADFAVASALGLGQWLFEDIAPITLGAGHYVIGSVSGNDDFRTFQGSIALDPTLSNFDSGKFNFGGTLVFPTSDEASDFSLFGPNLAIPEPGTLLLVGIAMAALGMRRTSKQNA